MTDGSNVQVQVEELLLLRDTNTKCIYKHKFYVVGKNMNDSSTYLISCSYWKHVEILVYGVAN